MMTEAATMKVTLPGSRVLVVEDNYMVAQGIAEALSDAGADVLGPVPSVDDALRLVAAEGRIDGALLNVKVRQEGIWPVVDLLLARGVPLVLATSYAVSTFPPGYAHLTCCENPASGRELARALASQLRT